MKTTIAISQSVAILIDGNNIERSIHEQSGNTNTMLNIETLVPKLIGNRALNRLIYFREGKQISEKLAERLQLGYHGSVRPCHKSADIPLSITAVRLASKVDTVIIMSGDSDYVELVRHLKSEGVRVEVAAVAKTTSSLLHDEVDHFHAITESDWFLFTSIKRHTRRSSAVNAKPKAIGKPLAKKRTTRKTRKTVTKSTKSHNK